MVVGARFGRLAVLIVVLVLAGCSHSTGSSGPSSGPSAGPSSPPPTTVQPGSSAELGDLSLVDPCSLTRPETFGQYGRAAQGRPVSLDYCVTTIDTPDGSHLEIASGELRTVDPATDLAGLTLVPVGPLQLAYPPLQQGECSRPLVFTDHVALETRVDLFVGDSPLDLCAVADAAARQAADTIARHAVGHRDPPQHSLSRLDPCHQLPDSALSRLPDFAGKPAVGAPGRHQCSWGGQAPKEPRLRLLFGAGDPPAVHDETASAEKIVGRDTVLTRIGGGAGPALCTVETAHLPFGPAGSGSVELATVVVVLPSGDMNQSCADGRTVAEAVWPTLPPTA